MGYSTEFTGCIKVRPSMSPDLVRQINTFCEERHGEDTVPHEGMPTFWCDFRAAEDGSHIGWSGSEKSYHMAEWAKILIDRFIAPAGLMAHGRMLAQGEDIHDRWELVVEANHVRTETLR